jgi:Ca2+-binding EF-hand superfamily protein
MKKAAGLLIATGFLTIASHGLAEPSSRSAANESARAKRIDLDGARDVAQPSRTAPSVKKEDPAPLTLFAAADRDRNGSVSYGEFGAVVRESIARRVAARFRQLDRNHDGRCTRSEVNKMSAARFARFDSNRDGFFTIAELSRVMTQELTGRLDQVYARLDRNRDGRFSVAELTPQPQQPAPAAVAQRKSAAGRKTTEVARREPSGVQ